MIEKNFLVPGKVLKFGNNYFTPQRAIDKSHPHIRYDRFRVQHAVPTTVRGDSRSPLFQWLSWIPGYVNQIPLGALDVLSGGFTGCWMAIYQMNGRPYVGHIGTNETPNSANTVAVKQAWRDFVNTPLVGAATFTGFQPHMVLFDPTVRKLLGAAQNKVLGLVTTERKCFSVVLLGEAPDTWRVAAVRQQQPRGLSRLFPV